MTRFHLQVEYDGGEFHADGGDGHERCAAAYLALVDSIEKVLGDEALDARPREQ